MSREKRIVVVVDDDVEMNNALQRLLNAAGYRTTTFPSAEALLADELAVSADCFVFDIHLPGISGFELQQQLAQSGTNTAVIFITAYEDRACRQQAQRAGAVALFAKPFEGRQLLAAIAGAVMPS
jgi:FixJ family two-component response regulator